MHSTPIVPFWDQVFERNCLLYLLTDQQDLDQLDHPTPPVKFMNPPGVYNPNWKGPMPLYPDELNNIMSQLPESPMYHSRIISPQTKKTIENADEGGIEGTSTSARYK